MVLMPCLSSSADSVLNEFEQGVERRIPVGAALGDDDGFRRQRDFLAERIGGLNRSREPGAGPPGVCPRRAVQPGLRRGRGSGGRRRRGGSPREALPAAIAPVRRQNAAMKCRGCRDQRDQGKAEKAEAIHSVFSMAVISGRRLGGSVSFHVPARGRGAAILTRKGRFRPMSDISWPSLRPAEARHRFAALANPPSFAI